MKLQPVIQQNEYMPSGELFSEQRDNWATPYKFNSKELDQETGLYYYGARYYNPTLSIWVSVDPMSDKYPSMSPYMYCAGNPVILVDPDGREVFIHGDAADNATSVLSTKNIKITRAEDGKLSYTGKARTKDERKLVKAINSDKVTVNLTANKSNSMVMDDGTTIQSANGGAFLGNTINEGKASTKQFVSMDLINKNFDSWDVGAVVAHEITESFYGGLISLKKGIDALPAAGGGANNPIFLKAHKKASTQPYLKNEKKQILEEKKEQENTKPYEDRFAFPKYRTR